MKTITPRSLSDLSVGDKVVLSRSAHLSATRRDLEVGRAYSVTGIHPHTTDGRGGTITIEGASNPDTLKGWAPGSYGFGFFEKVVDPCADISNEDLIEALKDRGYTGTLTRVTTEEVTL